MPHAPALQADLVVGNFEGVLGDSGTTYKCGPEGRRVPDRRHPHPEAGTRAAARPSRRARRHRGRATPSSRPTALAPRLVEAGFTHLNLANNHANDFGPDGRATTERSSTRSASAHYGPLGQHRDRHACAGATASTAVGLVGFTTYPYAYDLLDIARSARWSTRCGRWSICWSSPSTAARKALEALHVPEAAESLGRRAPRRSAALGARGDRRRRRRGGGARPPRPARDRVLPRASRSSTRWGTFSPIAASTWRAHSASPACCSLEFGTGSPLAAGASRADGRSAPGQGPAPDSTGAGAGAGPAAVGRGFRRHGARESTRDGIITGPP